MASPKAGYGLPIRPSDGFRRRPEDPRLLSGIPKSTSRTNEKETREADVPKKQESSQSRGASRVPLPSSVRRPSATQQSAPKIALPDRHSKSWGSATSSSGYSRSHTQTESGSSSSSRSFDGGSKLGQNAMRRKKPSLSPEVGSLLSGSPNLGPSSPKRQSQVMMDSALGIQFDRGVTTSPSSVQKEEQSAVPKPVGQSPVIYPELDRYRHYDRTRIALNRPVADVPYRLATHDLPPPTPGSLLFSANSSQISAISGSPSTKFSASPGPGPYSRDTTPTSVSSQSPGLVVPSRGLPLAKVRQHSPALTRPPVTRRRTGSISNEVDSISVDPHGLAAVRESLTSSSSSSTVKGSIKNPRKERKGGKSLAAPPPSPPPRKSSQKFRTSEDDEELSPRQRRQQDVKPLGISSPPKASLALRNHQSPSPQAMPPRRPSRDGTSDLKSQLFTPIPVIQSSLALRAANLERRDSETTPTHPSQLSGLQTNKSASTSNLLTSEQPAPPAASSRRKLSISGPIRPSGAPAPNVKSSSSRFPFFGRKKATSESTSDDKDKKDKQKVSRKGPAAGTGHEGYGRIGAVRRRSAVMPNAQVSNESLVSGDSFLADRINPVVIAGGAVIENRNASAELSRTESNMSLATNERPSIDSIANSIMSSDSRDAPRGTLWPSAIPRGLDQVPNARRPSDSTDTSSVAMGSTLAFRRSIQRLKSFPDNPLQLPRPINTSGVVSSPITSFDTSIMSDESSLFNLQQQPSHELSNVPPAPNKLKKKPRSPRKWNFFSRSNNQSKPEKASETVTVTVQPVEKKPMAFYTMMDSPEQELAGPVDLKEILREADAYARSPAKFSSPEMQTTGGQFPTTSGLQSPANIIPQYPFSGPDPYAAAAEPTIPRMEGLVPTAVTLSSGRPSRLPQVGRIPQVVSNRLERTSPRSFSRPFGANQQPLPLHMPPARGIGINTRVPNFSKPATPIPDASGEGSTTDAGTEFSFFSEPRPHISPEPPATREFLSFSPRKNSDCTTTTSSTESCVYSYAEATAVIPKPDDPPAEDEVWDEYDDFLGEEAVKDRQSATSSKGIPFHLETYHMKLAKEKALESPTIVTDSRKLSTLSDAPTASTSYSADMTERIRKAFQPHPSPTVPLPIPESAKQNNGGHSRKPSAAETARHSTVSSHKSRQSTSSSSSEEGTPVAQVNLRVGSMTVSKWLTFGQVLFSDIRHGLVRGRDSLERPSVLVIDGLGNDDWSFYAAETYSGANFFNLSPRAPLPDDVQSSASRYPLSPPNHHQVQYLSHLDKFPFAAQTFDCVVYRFPIAAPESHYQNILVEARRVLKAGGYLELSILDVDLNNMGNRGRRAIRQLKERIHEASPETNLASTADLIVRLLGKSGFSTIKAARVGVPVASSITSSDDNAQGKGSAEGKKKKSKDQPSLAEMMRDHSPNADEGITNMVSRVGRWWYSRCYENAGSHPSGKSIWNDKALLRECEDLGTSLKLMVCCARAPERIDSV